MKRTYLLVAACMAVTAIFPGCKKGGELPGPDPGHPGCSTMWAHHERFPELQSKPQTFTIQAGTSVAITAANGTKFNFYPNSFKGPDGNVVTFGTINITLTEAYTPGAMIANRSTSYYKGTMLQTGGQVSIQAVMNGIVLSANKYGIAFRQPAAANTGMALFYGTMDNPDSSANWTDYNNMSVGSFTTGTSVEPLNDNTEATVTGNFYRFDSCTRFGYVASGRFLSSPELTNVNVVIANKSFSSQNTEVYIVSRSTNSAMICYAFDYSTGTFNMGDPYDGNTGQVPVGAVVDIVAVSFHDNSYYYCHKAGVTVTSGMSVNLTMAQQTVSYVQTDLAGF